jgi:hypothetical protein
LWICFTACGHMPPVSCWLVWQSVFGTLFQPVFPDSSDDGDNPTPNTCLLCHSDRRLKKSKLTDASKPLIVSFSLEIPNSSPHAANSLEQIDLSAR